ncbi:VWA domain-containing protein [Marmoricola endophyticus]|uniref:VWA domain-containing protein n=1 Tax=Marmoricola endophyticus TaxID=2040280 RepID=A0A917F5R7_9ACTN|nr:VWA domain-containing protein [Marmoricola endophyticus]GGF46208.1 VWA domain-containing protein [Marmoricola endophyticus]
MTALVDRQVAFVAALRRAGLAVSLAEDLDGVRALEALPLLDRSALRAGLAATLVKKPSQRPTFDALFDLYYPALLGSGEPGEGVVQDVAADESGTEQPERQGLPDGPEQLADFRERLAQELEQAAAGEGLDGLAREAVERFGAMPGRAPGQSSWSAYTALHRVHPQALVDRLAAALLGGDPEAPEMYGGEPAARRRAEARVQRFTAAVEADARRRIAEQKGADHMAHHAVRPSVELLDFTSARRADLARMRAEIQPLARRLATRLGREHSDRRRGTLDFRGTVRASMSTGGVPIETRHKPRRPTRTDLVVLCDVSGSVASFAQFTLMLVHALREQFSRVRAFTFVDDVHEVTDVLVPGGDPVDILADLSARAAHASRFGRTDYGKSFERFWEQHADALTPRSNLLVLGDARSNHSDLSLPTLAHMAHAARHSWWLNPEHPRHWDSGDSAAGRYGAIVPMVECRNLTQLGEFVGRLAENG